MGFFRKPGVKAVGAILCILSLTGAALSGLLVAILLNAGGYTGGNAFSLLVNPQLNMDMQSVLYEYFDASDPTHPWVSYYSGGIYTGDDSNFRYEITDESGEVLLSTYSEDLDYSYSDSLLHVYTTELVSVQDPYALTSALFTCDGQWFYYDEDQDAFSPLEAELSDLTMNMEELPSQVFQDGFTYHETHYEYSGMEFYPNHEWESTTFSTVSHRYTLSAYLLEGFPYDDNYRAIWEISSNMMSLRYELLWMFAICTILGLGLLILLGCTVGRLPGKDEPVLCLIYRVPSDLALALAASTVAFGVVMAAEFYMAAIFPMVVFVTLGALAAVTGMVYFIMLVCAKSKTHTLFSSSILGWCWRKASALCRQCYHLCTAFFSHLPMIWKVVAAYGGLTLLEFLLLARSFDAAGQFLLWMLEKAALGVLVCYVTLCFRRLKYGAECIAAGDYTAKVSERHLVLDFKDTANTLNHIQDGMNAAVDSRMKSERLKTELITNVSHDLKTPLTSIVTYVDLLKQEPAGSPAASEYLEVLDRQSARLKKLIEDLVEASKASTGNITVHPEPLDMTMLLGQAVGEYNQRLTNASLTPVLRTPEPPVMIRADGRLLWRVFDNLLGNIVKYAMPGTRVYLSVDVGEQVTATFRNISRDPLDVTPDELLERFVRGDASRHTEGSGLGLSIARSLLYSMGGSFELQVDGDLFKAVVSFPPLPPAEAKAALPTPLEEAPPPPAL